MTFKKLLIAAAVASAIAPSQADESSQNFVVEDIRVRGLQRVALGAALTYIPVRVGDTVDSYAIQQSIRELYSSTHFADIKAMREGDSLVFEVQERPTIAEIVFEGNSDIEDEQIQESLADQGIVEGDPLDLTSISGIETGLEDFYHSVGKYNAEIEVEIANLPRNRVRVNIDFKEGDAAEIQQINIVGNKEFTDTILLAEIELKDDLPWYNIIGEKRYQKQQLGGDLETLESFYRDRGYLQFQIESVQVSMAPSRDGVYITLNLNEGEQFNVRETSVVGDLKGQDRIIGEIIKVEPGTLYSAARITYIEETIASIYGSFGYAYPEVNTIPEIDEETNEVDLVFQVNPGNRVYVNRINFSGNHVTKDEVLRREMVQLEGTWLSDRRVEGSKLELERLGYFETVDVDTVRVDGEDDLVDVNFDVKEQPSGAFNVGVGYGDYSKLQLNAGITQNNFLGTGNRAGINVNTNRFNRQLSLNYTDSFFTKDGVSLSGQAYLSEFDAGNVENYIRYNQRTYGLGASVGWPINQNNRLDFGLTYKNQEVSNVEGYEQVTNFYRPFVDENDPLAGVSFNLFEASAGWSRVTLNRGTFPTAGSSNRISLRASTPNSDLKYFTVNYDFDYYFPLTDDHSFTVLTRLNLGYGNGYGDDGRGNEYLLPFWEYFRVGGNDNLRGFEANTVGPRAVYRYPGSIPGPGDPTGNPGNIPLPPGSERLQLSRFSVGGNAKVVGGLELIVPTPFLSEGYRNSVRTSLYVDVGTVWDTEFDYDFYRTLDVIPDVNAGVTELTDYSQPSDFRASAGISVQWISPMGPLTFSLGRPIKSLPGDDTQTFSFNIGTTF